MKKLVKDGKSVRAAVSLKDNTCFTERTVYVDENSKEFIKINGSFAELDFYKRNLGFKFHGYSK